MSRCFAKRSKFLLIQDEAIVLLFYNFVYILGAKY